MPRTLLYKRLLYRGPTVLSKVQCRLKSTVQHKYQVRYMESLPTFELGLYIFQQKIMAATKQMRSSRSLL